MKEFIDKLISRLEEKAKHDEQSAIKTDETEKISLITSLQAMADRYRDAIEIVNELAEEYNNDFCEWKQYDDNDIYYTGCEQIHMFIDGSPTDNKYEFCPYCGKKIKVAPYTEGE